MAETLSPKQLFPGVPNTVRGEPAHISVSGTRVAYASGRVAVVRSLTDPLDARVFALHTAPVTAASFSADGTLVASADDSGAVRVWNPDNGLQKAEFHASPAPIRDLAFSPCAKFLAIAGESRGAFAKVLKTPSGGGAGVCKGHTKRAVACDAAAGFVATGSEDMTVGIFKGPPVREFDTPRFLRHTAGFVNDVKFSPDAKFLAVASSDRTVSIVDLSDENVVCTISEHGASVTGVCWINNNKILTSSNDKTVRTWNVPDGSCVESTSYGTDVRDMQVGCGYSPEGHIVSVSLRPQINITDPGASDVSRVLRGHAKLIVGLAAVGGKVYTADYSGLLVAWDMEIGASNKFFNGKGPTTSVCAIAANDNVVASVGQDGKVYVTPTDTLTYTKPVTVKGGGVDIAVPTTTTSEFSAVMVNETRLVAVSPDGSSIVDELALARGETGCAVAVTSDGKLFAVGIQLSGGSGEVRFFTLEGSSFSQAGEAMRMPSAPNRLAFSPDGELLAVGEKSRRVKLYNATTRSMITGGGVFHTARVDAIAFSPDGRSVASGGMDGSVGVWPVDSEDDPIKLKTAHRNGVTGIAFTDSVNIVTSGGDSCVRLWSL